MVLNLWVTTGETACSQSLPKTRGEQIFMCISVPNSSEGGRACRDGLLSSLVLHHLWQAGELAREPGEWENCLGPSSPAAALRRASLHLGSKGELALVVGQLLMNQP